MSASKIQSASTTPAVGTSLSATFASEPSVGSLLVVSFQYMWLAEIPPPLVSDNFGNTYRAAASSRVVYAAGGPAYLYQVIAYAIVGATGSDFAVTVHFSTTALGWLTVSEWSGAVALGQIASQSAVSLPNPPTTTAPSAGPVNVGVGELVYCSFLSAALLYSDPSTGAPVSPNPGSGFSLLSAYSDPTIAYGDEFVIAPSSGPIAGLWQAGVTGLDGTPSYTALVVTFRSTGNIVVQKATSPSGSLQAFTFRPSYGASFTLHDGEFNDSGPLAPGTYSVTEALAGPEWVPPGVDATRTTSGSPGGTYYPVQDPAAIEVIAGATIAVTFRNVYSPFPNEVFRMSYRKGWSFPEFRTRTGKLVTGDDVRAWSRDVGVSTRLGKYLKRTLTAPVDSAGPASTVVSAVRFDGFSNLRLGGDYVPPVAVGDRVRVAISATGHDGFNGDYPVTEVSRNPSVITYAQPGIANDSATGASVGTLALLGKIEDHSALKTMATRQMTYALSSPAKWKTYPLASIARATQIVTAVVPASLLIAGGATVAVSGAGSFDGAFPVSSVNANGDGTSTLRWAQNDVDESEDGGTLSTTIGAVRLSAFQPGRLDDCGDGIDSQYEPALTQAEGMTMRFAGIRGMARGAGKLLVRMVTDDEDPFENQDIDLPDTGKPTHFVRAASNAEPFESEHAAPLFSNGKVPGSGFEIQECVVYAIPWLPTGTDNPT